MEKGGYFSIFSGLFRVFSVVNDRDMFRGGKRFGVVRGSLKEFEE